MLGATVAIFITIKHFIAMCTKPNTNTEAITDVFTYVMHNNLNNFKEENDDIIGLSLSLDELFAGYLDSQVSELDDYTRLDRFRDYLKIKELLQIIQ